MATDSPPAIWWARRDLRLADNPALQAAVEQGRGVLPLFVLDPVLLRSAGQGRRAWLHAALHALDSDIKDAGGPGLSIVRGTPTTAVPRVVEACGAKIGRASCRERV